MAYRCGDDRDQGDRRRTSSSGWLAIAAAVRPDRAGSVGDYLDWKRQAEDMAWFVASVDGEDAGCALAYVGWHSAPGTGNGRGVRAARAPRRRGRLRALPRARGLGAASAAASRSRRPWPRTTRRASRWADRRGFREVGRSSRLVLDLTAIEAPAVDPPEGVEIVTWAERPDLARAIYEVACEAYPDEPGEARQSRWTPYETWLSKDMRGDSDRPEATFIALADGEVAGLREAVALELRARTVAHHDMTGVKRAFRGRGIAGALKRAEIAWAKQAGYETLETSERGAERADPPPQRAPRLRGAARRRRAARLARRDRVAGRPAEAGPTARLQPLGPSTAAPSAPAPSAAWRRGRRSCAACRPCPCPARARSRASPCRP